MPAINLTDPLNDTLADANLISANNALLENLLNGGIDTSNVTTGLFLQLATTGGQRKVDFGHASGTSDGSGQIAVSFAAAFPSAPFVLATPANASHAIIVRVQSITTVGFLATFFTTAGALDTAQSQDCFWIAIA